MNINLEDYLNETTMTSTGVGGFVGSKGQGIDEFGAGPFYPSEDDLLLLWKLHNVDVNIKKSFSDKETPLGDIVWKQIDWDYKYDEEGNAYKLKELIYDKSGIDETEEFVSNFKNQSSTEMKLVDIYKRY